jgi:hypothetical protein
MYVSGLLLSSLLPINPWHPSIARMSWRQSRHDAQIPCMSDLLALQKTTGLLMIIFYQLDMVYMLTLKLAQTLHS